eukprot:TRINITY_DN11882_c0_g1_i2.p1 TRINITY_DN11882_c0_g1~~TRINITY_DN11882_c0_g1_i2.p1  ORF type:complete len:554 (+),score=62.25 TRINITY_DN11882_c0_g1_i2:71-1732(+)
MGSKVEATVAFEQVGWSAPFASSSSGKPSSRRSYAAVVAGEPPRSRRLFLELTTCGVSEPAKCVLVAPSLTLEDVPEKAYKSAMSHLDVASLCQFDAACRWLCWTNRATLGPWHTHCVLTVYGLEMYDFGDFEAVMPVADQQFEPDWTHRYKVFHLNISTFMGHVGFERFVYCSMKFRADLLVKDISKGMYMEIAVDQNPDRFTISIVDEIVLIPTSSIISVSSEPPIPMELPPAPPSYDESRRTIHCLFLEITAFVVPEPSKCILTAPSLTLEDVPEEAYNSAMLQLDVASLCQLDAACRWLRRTNRATLGPWHTLGALTFYGLEMYYFGDFEAVMPVAEQHFEPDWKHRYKVFHLNKNTFMGYDDFESTVYCSLMLRADLLGKDISKGMYMEIAVDQKPDRFSISLVNESVLLPTSSTACVCFSPEDGCVILERRCRPQAQLYTTYLHPLRKCERHLLGNVGIYILSGHVAFFRKCSADWESTGFVIELSWLDCLRLILAVSFRDLGAYSPRVVSVSSEPPVPMELPLAPPSCDESGWKEFPNVLEFFLDS